MGVDRETGRGTHTPLVQRGTAELVRISIPLVGCLCLVWVQQETSWHRLMYLKSYYLELTIRARRGSMPSFLYPALLWLLLTQI
jgi:hypothetical protein